MFESFFTYLEFVDESLWNYIGVPAILCLGLYLSYKAKFMQVIHFSRVTKIFFDFLKKNKTTKQSSDTIGIHPLKAFFAAVGGCIGVGNVIVVCTAVQLGGPGAVFWMWITAFIGMIVKYSEIYLGITYRIKNKNGGYSGGPMYFLQQVFSGPLIPILVCILLCIYGVDMYMFRTVTHAFTQWWGWNEYFVIVGLLLAVLLGGEKGMERVGTISSAIIPLFLTAFSLCSLWIFILNWHALPSVFISIFTSAFTPHAAIGAFTGVGLLTTITHGMKRACYTGDIGIGYASIIHSETAEANPARQASLGIFGIFLDTFVVCTITVLLILVTGTWHQGIHEEQIVAHILSQHIPYIHILWPIFIFLLGYSSILAVFASGTKAAQFLSPLYGKSIYNFYAIIMFVLFSFIGEDGQILTTMSFIGCILLLINLWGMVKLAKKIRFTLPKS